MTTIGVFGNVTGSQDEYTGFKVQVVPYVVFIDIIVGLGLFGNIVNVVVMATPSMRQFSFATYMIFLAISDSFVLVTTLVEDNLDHIYHSLDSLLRLHISFCRFWNWVMLVSTIISPWTLAAVTFDRFVTLILYRYRERICKMKVAMIVCGVIFSVAVVMVSPAVHALEYIQDGDRIVCNAPGMKMQTYVISVTVIMTSVLPVLIIVCLNGTTVARLCRSAKKDTSVDEENIRKLSISLVLVSVLSAVALIPLGIVELVQYIYVISGEEEKNTELLSNLWMIFNVIRLLNFAMNFYVLFIFSAQFRQSLRGLCPCFSRRDQGLVTDCEDTVTHNRDDADLGMSNIDTPQGIYKSTAM